MNLFIYLLLFNLGVFGMNFSHGGGLVYVLEVYNGTYAFLVVCILSLIILFTWFFHEGFFEMLTKKEVNKHVNDLQKQQSVMNSNKGKTSFSMAVRKASPVVGLGRQEGSNLSVYMAQPHRYSAGSKPISEPLMSNKAKEYLN